MQPPSSRYSFTIPKMLLLILSLPAEITILGTDLDPR